jgi:pyruvate,orthophosphate dikinase
MKGTCISEVIDIGQKRIFFFFSFLFHGTVFGLYLEAILMKKPPSSKNKVSRNFQEFPSKGKSIRKKPAVTKKRLVYFFGQGEADGDGGMKALLGGKGANLAEMTRIGLPVPPGFTITTEVCTHYYANDRSYPEDLDRQVDAGIRKIEKIMGLRFGDDTSFPLLVSVRSGARDSMPGMMDTILNLGLNDRTVTALARSTGNESFAWDCYRRFIQMYGDVVMGVQKLPGDDHEPFEQVIHELKMKRYGTDIPDNELTASDSSELVNRFKQLVKRRSGREFPEDPWVQLRGAIGAVFGSWMNDRAVVYRRKYHIPHEWGTAVSVQAMVFGNTGENSGSGVAFTRNPASGDKELYGEFLINAQGEDVVAGVRTPEPVGRLRDHLPAAHAELQRIRELLEGHFRDVQDFEFTIQEGKLFMLQTRSGKRTAIAALKFSMDMVSEGLIDRKTAIQRNPADQIEQLLAPVFDAGAVAKAQILATGLPAGPGAASGKIYLNAERAVEAAAKGEPVILVRMETSPEDLRGMIAAQGILTARGGVSSHAALVARQMGKVCVCGVPNLHVDYRDKVIRVGGKSMHEGDFLSIDGTAGTVYAGKLSTMSSEIVAGLIHGDADARKTRKFRDFKRLMDWCSEFTKLEVRTNADTPEQTRRALAFGAKGVGLCRTEHMFFEGDRINAMREMILADNERDRRSALAKLLPYQRKDFAEIFRELKGLPATIRLLDPPLHEFLPNDVSGQEELSRRIGVSVSAIARRVRELHEFNPMLGHRGCRLGITYPEITEMQAHAVFESALEVAQTGLKVRPEIMVPLVGDRREFDLQAEIIHSVASEVLGKKKRSISYTVGTMIEVPRAALMAGSIAGTAQFFSFGTNDLTQTTLGISRDDMGSFATAYTENEIFARNPFATLDQDGVGLLMKMAVSAGRESNPDLKIGICGEHGGDPASITFCHRLGINYVSCSPYRVPVARLAAAQAALAD